MLPRICKTFQDVLLELSDTVRVSKTAEVVVLQARQNLEQVEQRLPLVDVKYLCFADDLRDFIVNTLLVFVEPELDGSLSGLSQLCLIRL